MTRFVLALLGFSILLLLLWSGLGQSQDLCTWHVIQAFMHGHSQLEHFVDFLQCLHRTFWSRFLTSIPNVWGVSDFLHLLQLNITAFESSFWCIVIMSSHRGVSREATFICFKSSSHCVFPSSLKILGIKEQSPLLSFFPSFLGAGMIKFMQSEVDSITFFVSHINRKI